MPETLFFGRTRPRAADALKSIGRTEHVWKGTADPVECEKYGMPRRAIDDMNRYGGFTGADAPHIECQLRRRGFRPAGKSAWNVFRFTEARKA